MYETEEADIESSSRICKPNRKLEKSVIKNNMSNNGEVVGRLASTIQKRSTNFYLGKLC